MMMINRMKRPDAWLVEAPGKKRQLVDADKYDAESPGFWISGKAPEGTTVTPLYRPPHSAPDGEDLSPDFDGHDCGEDTCVCADHPHE